MTKTKPLESLVLSNPDLQEPTGLDNFKEWIKPYCETVKNYLTRKGQQIVEDLKDIAVATKLATQKVELTPAYIDQLFAQTEADGKAFEEIVKQQYGERYSQLYPQGNGRALARIKTRYNGTLKRLNRLTPPSTGGNKKLNLPEETMNKLVSLVIAYELSQVTDKIPDYTKER